MLVSHVVIVYSQVSGLDNSSFSYVLLFLQVIVTERAGHARDVLASITNRDLSLYDGVVAVVSSCTLLLVRFLIFNLYGTWVVFSGKTLILVSIYECDVMLCYYFLHPNMTVIWYN